MQMAKKRPAKKAPAKKKAGKKPAGKQQYAMQAGEPIFAAGPPQTVKISSTHDGATPAAATFADVSGFCRVTKPADVVCRFGTLDEMGPGALPLPIEAAAAADPAGSVTGWKATFAFG